jgi:ribonucleoside-diphosphate reductase alpha chain
VTFDTNGAEEEFKRPNRLNSETFTVETGNGKMYVTVSDDDGKPIEVFIFLGKSGQILNTFTEGLGRCISLALQNNVPLEKITRSLSGINSDTIAWHRFEDTDLKPTQILSIPDGIAKLLDKYYLNKEFKQETNGHPSSEICPKCQLPMVATEGCFSCSCGHSKCS